MLIKIVDSLSAGIGETITLVCNIQTEYPAWQGPPDNLIYTIQGDPTFNPALGLKLQRLKWASNRQDLILSNIEVTDKGNYTCFAGAY